MSQIAQLSEAEIEARFHITGRTSVQFTLAGYARNSESFSVQFGAGESFLSVLLDVDVDEGELIFDCSGSSETNRRFLDSDRVVFVGRPGGVPVQFETGRAREVSLRGGKAFAVDLPSRLIRLQRREYFRVETPRVKPLMFFGRLPGGALLKLPAHDISVSGIGLNADALPDDLVMESVLENCHLMLPGETKELFFAAIVRRIVEMETRSGTRYWRVGLEFRNLSTGDETRIQRYIDRLERERRELS